MPDVREYLDVLADLGHPVVQHLRPGIDMSEITRFETVTSLKLPDEIAKLFALHNGTDFSGDIFLGQAQFVDGFHLMSLSEAIEAKEIVDEAIEDSPFVADEPHAFDRRCALPFLDDGAGDYMVVDVQPSSKRFGWIGTFLHAGDSRPDEFSSFSVFLAAHYEAAIEGVYRTNSKGFLDAPHRELESVLGRHKPAMENKRMESNG
ncbi:MAG: SMI1/KNR4 family protein [Verrucomicrobiota bacterium]